MKPNNPTGRVTKSLRLALAERGRAEPLGRDQSAAGDGGAAIVQTSLDTNGFGEVAADPIFTPALKLRFLDELSRHGNVRVAAAKVGVSRSGTYLARRRDVAFAAGWRAALVLARDHAEAVLAERALEGVEEAVFFRGEVIAVRRRFDSRLLLAHLARLDQLCGAEAAAGASQFDAALAEIAGVASADAAPPVAASRAAHVAAMVERAGENYDRAAPQVDPNDPGSYDLDGEVWYDNDAVRAAEEEAVFYDAALDAAEAKYDAARAVCTAAAAVAAGAAWDARHRGVWAAVDALLAAGAPLEIKSLGAGQGFAAHRTLSSVSTGLPAALAQQPVRACRLGAPGLAHALRRESTGGTYG